MQPNPYYVKNPCLTAPCLAASPLARYSGLRGSSCAGGGLERGAPAPSGLVLVVPPVPLSGRYFLVPNR
eukprot:scaffold4277_cov24-Tisochrysis_lutea.AAC.4